MYLAGPDVFLPNAAAHAAEKCRICAAHGLDGMPPLNDDDLLALAPDAAWRAIFDKDLAMMQAADLVIANLTPFRGASADAGTLVELGWFLGAGKPIFAYSNTATPFAERSRAASDPIEGLQIEGFGLPDNLMIPGAVLKGGGHGIVLPPDGIDQPFDSLDIFARCVALAASSLSQHIQPVVGGA